MAREAARIGRLLISEQVRSVTYTLEEREAVVLVNTIASGPPNHEHVPLAYREIRAQGDDEMEITT